MCLVSILFMQVKKRGRLELVRDFLLSVVDETKSKTNVMYDLKVSWNTFTSVYDLAKNRGLVEEIKPSEDRTQIYITEKGKKVLWHLLEATKELGNFEDEKVDPT